MQLHRISVHRLRAGAREQLPRQLLPGGGVYRIRGHHRPAAGPAPAPLAATVLPLRPDPLVAGGAHIAGIGLLRGLRTRPIPGHRCLHGSGGESCLLFA